MCRMNIIDKLFPIFFCNSQALKEELKKAQSNDSGSIVGSTPPPAPVVQGSIEDLSAKLAAYQKFMSEYVVKAQLEKYEAVKAAEVSIAKKYEDKLNAFMLTGGVEEKAGAIAPASASSDDNKLFEQRNAHLAAAAKAGKSRWGNQEIEKVSGIVVEKTTPATPTPVENPPPNASPEVIAKADHGLRADGGVGGLTLTERVVNGSEAVNGRSASVVASSSSDSSLYAMRNARVAEAAKAGKSRWGSQEVEKVTDIMSKAPQTMKIEASPEVEAADHGLRADGGVGGPSLAERVNLGAQLLE